MNISTVNLDLNSVKILMAMAISLCIFISVLVFSINHKISIIFDQVNEILKTTSTMNMQLALLLGRIDIMERLIKPPLAHPDHFKGTIHVPEKGGFIKPGSMDPKNNGLYKAYVPGKDPDRVMSGREERQF